MRRSGKRTRSKSCAEEQRRQPGAWRLLSAVTAAGRETTTGKSWPRRNGIGSSSCSTMGVDALDPASEVHFKADEGLPLDPAQTAFDKTRNPNEDELNIWRHVFG